MNSTTGSSEISASVKSLQEQIKHLSQFMQFALAEPSNIMNQQMSQFANDISCIACTLRRMKRTNYLGKTRNFI